LASVLEADEYTGYSSRYMVSGAGHDCNYINQVAPAAMLFVPFKVGRSHFGVDYGFRREIMV
jgi:N-carbamoyl-L-amino-acid hydrolase